MGIVAHLALNDERTALLVRVPRSDFRVHSGVMMDAVRTLIDGGGAGGAVAVVALVFGLFLVRTSVMTPFATITALDHGLNVAGVLALRALSSLVLVGAICWLVGRWYATRRGDARPQGQLGRLLERCRRILGQGSAFGNFLAAGYLLNARPAVDRDHQPCPATDGAQCPPA